MTDQIVDLIEAVMPGPQGAQGPQGVQGLPGTGAVPADEAVAGYVGTSGSSQTKTALQAMLAPIFVLVAAADSTPAEKAAASVVCTGEHDEATLQVVIDSMRVRGGTIRLCRGTYRLDAFSGTTCRAALRFDAGAQCSIRLEGPYYPQRSRSTKWDISEGAVLYVTSTALESLGDDLGFVITGYGPDADPDVWDHSKYPAMGLEMDGVGITLADNRHNVTCVDTNAFTINEIRRVSVGVDAEDAALDVDHAAHRCIGFRSVMQKQMNQRFDSCVAYGMWIGFDMGGEHVICEHCIAIRDYCGWRFYGTDATRGGHPLTCIECSDEVCRIGPVFGGASEIAANMPIPGITLINWNREVVADEDSVWYCMQQATEKIRGTMRGYVSYQISDGAASYRSTNRVPFWEPGHGINCTTLNITAPRSAGVIYRGMPNESNVDKATMLRGEGANYGQAGFATNTSLLRNDFRTDQGIGVPVFWDGRSWRTYLNELAVKGPNLFTCTPGSKNGFSWEKGVYGKEDCILLTIPAGSHSYQALTLATATLAKGDYELAIPQATGAAYFEIVFPSGNVGYTLASGEKLSISVDQEYKVTLRLNYSGSCPVQHREKLVPSIRKIWL